MPKFKTLFHEILKNICYLQEIMDDADSPVNKYLKSFLVKSFGKSE